MTPQADWVKEFEEICFYKDKEDVWGSDEIVNHLNAEHLGDVSGKLIPEIKKFIAKQIELAQQRTEKKVREDLIDELYDKGLASGKENAGVYYPFKAMAYLERLHYEQHQNDKVDLLK